MRCAFALWLTRSPRPISLSALLPGLVIQSLISDRRNAEEVWPRIYMGVPGSQVSPITPIGFTILSEIRQRCGYRRRYEANSMNATEAQGSFGSERETSYKQEHGEFGYHSLSHLAEGPTSWHRRTYHSRSERIQTRTTGSRYFVPSSQFGSWKRESATLPSGRNLWSCIPDKVSS
jgi:hypothetical protein